MTIQPMTPQKERLRLAVVIIAVLWFGFFTSKVIPQVSALTLLIILMGSYTWLVTLSMVHQKRMSLKRPRPLNLNYHPSISVVIAAHNEENVIADTVRQMLQVDYDAFELVVMDDRSTDNTPAILQQLSTELNDPRFRYYSRPQDAFPGKSEVLNDAMALTTGDVLCVFDADAFVKPDFLKKIVPFLADDNVGAVQARKTISNAERNWLTRCQNYEYSLDAYFQCGRESVYGAVEVRGNGELIKREAIHDVGGFNRHSITDDLDISTRLHLAGWDIRFADKVVVYEEGIQTFAALLKQRRRWAEGSLMRYLEHAGSLLTSRKVSIRTMMDMVAYMLQFMLPLWLGLDLILVGIDWLSGTVSKAHLISSLSVAPAVAFFVSTSLVVAIIRFNTRKVPDTPLPPKAVIRAIPNALVWAIITGVYMVSTWFPITFAMSIKILFQNERKIDWDRTTHLGNTPNS